MAREVRSGDLRDMVFGKLANRGLGLMIAGGDDRNYRGFGHTNSPLAFGHNGAGGQLAWVDPASGISLAYLEALPNFEPLFERNLEIYNSDERIPTPGIRGDYVFNFWKDADHKRGLWRRAPLAEYLAGEPAWEILLDLDALAEDCAANEVYEGLFGEPANVSACHAGLECGLIGEKLPGMDMLSFGPELQAVHSPDERAQISSAARFYEAFRDILKHLAE